MKKRIWLVGLGTAIVLFGKGVDAGPYTLQAQPILIGIGYDSQLGKHSVQFTNPDTGETVHIAQFAFDSGCYTNQTLQGADDASLNTFALGCDDVLYQISPGGMITKFPLDTADINTLRFYRDNQFITISYNKDTKETVVHLVGPNAPAKPIASIAFDAGSWKFFAFDVSVSTESVYIVSSANTLYAVNITTGTVSTVPLNLDVQAIKAYKGNLVAVVYNSGSQKNEFHIVSPTTGQTTLAASVAFDSGYWIPTSLAVHDLTDRAFAVSDVGSLYEIRLDTGDVKQQINLHPLPQGLDVKAICGPAKTKQLLNADVLAKLCPQATQPAFKE